jgi:hypothetical protein
MHKEQKILSRNLKYLSMGIMEIKQCKNSYNKCNEIRYLGGIESRNKAGAHGSCLVFFKKNNSERGSYDRRPYFLIILLQRSCNFL